MTTLYTVQILDSLYTFASIRKAKNFAAKFTKPCFGEVIVWIGQAGGMRA
jgi:hypothetical protein